MCALVYQLQLMNFIAATTVAVAFAAWCSSCLNHMSRGTRHPCVRLSVATDKLLLLLLLQLLMLLSWFAW